MGSAPAAVLDANAIIGLSKAGCFAEIQGLFTRVWVSPLVVEEITDADSKQDLESALLQWLTVEHASAAALELVSPLRSPADRSVLALCLDQPSAILVSGDRALVNRASRFGIATVSPPKVVQLLVEGGLITAARPYLERMVARGFGISPALLTEILDALGEL